MTPHTIDALKEQREQLWSCIDALLEENASLRADIQAVRDELARVRRNHLRRMAEATWDRLIVLQHKMISRGIMDPEPHKRLKSRLTRFSERCRHAIANNAKDEA